MTESILDDLAAHVERTVIAVAASRARQRQMRDELLAHLLGLYDEELPYSYGLDYDWVLRAAKVGSIGLVAQPLADIRKDGTSWYQGGAHKTAEGLECLLAKHPDIATSRRGHARILG